MPAPEKNIALFINSKAGKGKALQLSTAISTILQQQKISYAVFCDRWPSVYEEFTDAWIIGGDGTLNFFINHFPGINIPLVIFKGGTGNDVAWKLYGDISLEAQVGLALTAEPKPVDAGKCNGKIFINGVGIGFDGEVLESMNAIRFLGGHLGYLLAVIRKIFTFKEYLFTVSMDKGAEISGLSLLLMISNSSRTGGGFHVSPLADISDGLLNLVRCEKLPVYKRLKYLPVIEKGKHLHLPFIAHLMGKKFVVKCEGLVPAQLDGELIRDSAFIITVLPGQFLFRY